MIEEYTAKRIERKSTRIKSIMVMIEVDKSDNRFFSYNE